MKKIVFVKNFMMASAIALSVSVSPLSASDKEITFNAGMDEKHRERFMVYVNGLLTTEERINFIEGVNYMHKKGHILAALDTLAAHVPDTGMRCFHALVEETKASYEADKSDAEYPNALSASSESGVAPLPVSGVRRQRTPDSESTEILSASESGELSTSSGNNAMFSPEPRSSSENPPLVARKRRPKGQSFPLGLVPRVLFPEEVNPMMCSPKPHAPLTSPPPLTRGTDPKRPKFMPRNLFSDGEEKL